MKILNRNRILKVIENPKSALPILLIKLGIFNKLIHFTDYMFDYLRNIKTSEIVYNSDLYAIDNFSQTHATHYAPFSVFMLWMLKDTFKKCNSSHFIDIGCGKGRVCFYATKMFQRVTGIDFSPILIDEAKQNLKNFDVPYKNELNFELLDARRYLLPNEKCVIFMANPFDDLILKEFLFINESHFRNYKSVIIYATPKWGDTLISFGFVQIFEVQGVRGYSLQ
jgi:SAM-dependent methyltransferase